MDIKKLKVKHFVSLLNAYDDKRQWVKLINQYFNYRLSSRKICLDDELLDLESFVYMIKNMNIYYDKREKNNIINNIARFIVLSRDMDRYKTFWILSRKRVNELSDSEILNYIEIVLNNCYCCFVVSKLDSYIRRYLELDGDISRMEKLIGDNSLLFSKKELEYLKKFIYDNYINIILKDILKELRKDVISTLRLCYCFNKLNEIKIDDLGVNNLKLFKNVLGNVRNNEILSRVDNIEKLSELKKLIDCVSDKILNNSVFGTKIKNDIVLGNIVLSNTFSDECMNNIRLINYNLVKSSEERIITIDDPMSPDLDGAFSIRKGYNEYILKVYISDVPVFLRDNRDLCREVYLRGCTMYVRDYNNRCNINIDMLPQCLSHQYLSLNLDGYKDVIVFTFVIGVDGMIYSDGVNRESIMITDKLSSDEADEIIYSDEDCGLLQKDLRDYRDLCKIVSSNTKNKFLSNLNYNKMYDLVGFPSILVNYYVGNMADFAIYREHGIYTLDKGDGYTHSVTPLRRFVSDINLAFFLEQNGVVSFPNKDLYYVQDNAMDIVKYLNTRCEISKFVERNSNFVKKYIK